MTIANFILGTIFALNGTRWWCVGGIVAIIIKSCEVIIKVYGVIKKIILNAISGLLFS